MTDWIRAQIPTGRPDDLGPLQLAWLGDAVWELHQRLRHCDKPGRNRELHGLVVSEVKAEAQAKALKHLEPYLCENEMAMARRGRNKARRGPRKGEAATYGKATGFETMLGWLFLKNPARLAQLLDQLDQTQPDLS